MNDMRQNRKYLITLIAIFAVFGLQSCLEEVTYPDEPRIGFERFTEFTDNTAELVISFTDGDGNVGLDQGDTLDPYCPDECEFYYNLFLEYYELRDGEWTHIELDPQAGQIPFYYRVPRVEPTGQNPALNGEIKLDMPFYYLVSDYDTVRFEITLVDRALNISNMVRSRTFLKP